VQVFRTFLTALGKPNVIVTDEERAMHAALVELQQKGEWTGLHLYDAFHILHNARKKLARKEHVVYLARLLHSRNRNEYEQRLREARESLFASEMEVLDKFDERRNLYCFAHIEPTFISFCASSSPNEALHSLFKRLQPSQREYSLSIRNLATCC